MNFKIYANKWLFMVHVFLMVILVFLGFYFLVEYGGRAATAGIYYGSLSLFFFAYSIFLGVITLPRMPKTGILLLLAGIAFFCWSLLMISSPRHISLHEVFPAWIAYAVGTIVPCVVGVREIDKIPIPKKNYEDEILDDLDSL